MAGEGAPIYLGWSCLSVGASKDMFDMLIFHEDNAIIEALPCATNVKKINLHAGGLSKLIARAVANPRSMKTSGSSKERKLEHLLSHVLGKMPFFLAQFKIGSGAIFEEYLKEYTHWTYSDPDIIWSDLSMWLSPSELVDYDIITMCKIADANRLFLRGQFALHQNRDSLNWLWTDLSHMQVDNVISMMTTTQMAMKRGIPNNAIKRMIFISAEGAYSQHVFSVPGVSVLIAGRMFSDKSLKPVVWNSGDLSRCVCGVIRQCIPRQEPQFDNSYCMVRDSNHGNALPPINMQEEEVTGEDCGMNWLAEQYRHCISPKSLSSSRAVINEAILLEGKWHSNNEIVSPRLRKQVGAMFHFRVWEDDLSNKVDTQSMRPGTTCFIMYVSLADATLYVHECDPQLVKERNNAMLSKSTSKKIVYGMIYSHRKKQLEDMKELATYI
eukprot:CAMPEP_0185028952 /NCGR_PEP_ID=MMETSP1103-20130426/15049_1 /TAXON_ID=36769 /ORGANISM="Paraphysomonas bandaiensis, Strain Caron Lab Isolate" /LENGTH=439 /DNA_ID=CAMNT_0027563545 /DNA_START=160 /DNA_END=1476 /DNA_ORIENTATION=+